MPLVLVVVDCSLECRNSHPHFQLLHACAHKDTDTIVQSADEHLPDRPSSHAWVHSFRTRDYEKRTKESEKHLRMTQSKPGTSPSPSQQH